MRTNPISTIIGRLSLRKDGAGPSAAEIAANVASILKKNDGDATKVAETLLSENAKLREDKRNLKEENEKIKKTVPIEGAIVLTAEEAKDWEAFKALGKPDELKKKVDAHAVLEKKVADAERSALVEEAAKSSGFKPQVLAKLVDGLEIEMKEVPKPNDKGETVMVRVAFVKTDSGTKPLADHAKETWGDFMPSLTETPNGGPNPNGTGVQYPNNGGTSQQQGGNGNVVDDFIKQQNEARSKGTNPLMPQNTGA